MLQFEVVGIDSRSYTKLDVTLYITRVVGIDYRSYTKLDVTPHGAYKSSWNCQLNLYQTRCHLIFY